MKKRSITIGTYKTADHGWTLTGWTLTDPEQKTSYVEKVGGDGSFDLSTALSGGIPRYKPRTFTATLECSQGTREERGRLISAMVNELDGLEWNTVPPDHPDHYLTGRVHVAVLRHDLAYAEVQVTGTVDPWLYKARETVVEHKTTIKTQTIHLYNGGRKAVVPMLTVDGVVHIMKGEDAVLLPEGSYKWPSLTLMPGITTFDCMGMGSLTITYREAVLR